MHGGQIEKEDGILVYSLEKIQSMKSNIFQIILI